MRSRNIFWGEQFRRPDEEDIWEELKKMVTNPPTEEEIRLKKQQDQEWINSILDKAFPDEPKIEKEPYLTLEELGFEVPEEESFAGKKYNKPMRLQGEVNKIHYPNPYDAIQNNLDLSPEEKAVKIKELSNEIESQINREHVINQAKNYGGAALEIGSAAIPGGLGSKLIGKGVIKTAKPLIDQVVKKNIKRGAIEGATSGAVAGLGQGLLEDENLLKSTALGGLSGGAGGAVLGKIAGETVARTPKIKELDEVLDKRNDWGIAHRKLSGKPKEAIEKLLEHQKGFVPNAVSKEGIGDIDFVWGKQNYETGQGYGLEHIIDGRTRKNKIDGVEFVRSLPKTFENGNIFYDKRYPNNVYIEDTNNKIAIPQNYNDKKRNWLLTAHPQNKSASKRLATSAPMSKPNVDSRYNNFTTELTADNSIIPPTTQNLNPSQEGIPKPLSHNDWLEWLKRKRKNIGW